MNHKKKRMTPDERRAAGWELVGVLYRVVQRDPEPCTTYDVPLLETTVQREATECWLANDGAHILRTRRWRRQRTPANFGPDRPLACRVCSGELHIRIGINVLARATTNQRHVTATVTDAHAFATAVAVELRDGEPTGGVYGVGPQMETGTLVTRCLDAAGATAMQTGNCAGVCDVTIKETKR
jgi:hypothetical protein